MKLVTPEEFKKKYKCDFKGFSEYIEYYHGLSADKIKDDEFKLYVIAYIDFLKRKKTFNEKHEEDRCRFNAWVYYNMGVRVGSLSEDEKNYLVGIYKNNLNKKTGTFKDTHGIKRADFKKWYESTYNKKVVLLNENEVCFYVNEYKSFIKKNKLTFDYRYYVNSRNFKAWLKRNFNRKPSDFKDISDMVEKYKSVCRVPFD